MSLIDPQLTDELVCPICMEVMKEPVSLGNCQHNFCRGCITAVIASGAEEQPGELRCPTCRKRNRVDTALPENKLLKTMCDAARRAVHTALAAHATQPPHMWLHRADRRHLCVHAAPAVAALRGTPIHPNIRAQLASSPQQPLA